MEQDVMLGNFVLLLLGEIFKTTQTNKQKASWTIKKEKKKVYLRRQTVFLKQNFYLADFCLNWVPLRNCFLFLVFCSCIGEDHLQI